MTIIVLAACGLLFVLLLIGAGALYQALGRRRDASHLPPPGRLVDVDGTRFHIRCTGNGRPTVLLESGIAASSVSWVEIQRELSQLTRVCSYDRSGLGWSELSTAPRTASRIVHELHALLVQAEIPGPYVIVGHSFGGLLARLYAMAHPGDVAGLILLDPAHTCEWATPSVARLRMLGRGVALSRRGALLARLGFVRLSLALLTGGSRRLPKLMAKLSSGKGSSVPERLIGEVRKLPREVWPAVQSHWSKPEAFESMAQHLAALPAIAAQATSEAPALADLPLIVISASGLTAEQLEEHAALARLSRRGKHIVAAGSGHWVHLDRPDIVLAEVRDLLQRLGS